MKAAFLALAFLVSSVLPASAAHLAVACAGDSLHVCVLLTGDFLDPAGKSAHVRARVIGSCEPAVEISPQPIPFPPMWELADTVFTVPTIDGGRYMYFEIFGRDEQGHEFSVGDSGDILQYDMEACASDAVFGRGHIVGAGGTIILDPCAGHCWIGIPLDFSEAEPGWEAIIGAGALVNVYGQAYVSGMPPGSFFLVSRVVPEADPAGCDALGISVISWGALKGAYR
ncbi:MAG: hypothetical protein IPH86_13185 [bacterium]|nr:hypothetical protein [bacterium]